MKQIRQRLTYANIISTLALVLVVGGATAIAAHKVPKHSVGPHQLKSNAVTTPKIKANAVTTRKIKKNAITAVKIKDKAIKSEKLEDNAVTTAKLANGSVTGAKIDAATMPFGRIVQEARGNSTIALSEASLTVYPLQANSYTQPAGRDDTFVGAARSQRFPNPAKARGKSPPACSSTRSTQPRPRKANSSPAGPSSTPAPTP